MWLVSFVAETRDYQTSMNYPLVTVKYWDIFQDSSWDDLVKVKL